MFWNAILQTISKFSLFFLYFFSCVPFTIHAFPQNIFNMFGALFHCNRVKLSFPQGHWRISMQALVRFNAGIGASQRRHWCILTQASVRLSAGIGASQRRHWCMSMGALVHFNDDILVHFNKSTGAFQRVQFFGSMVIGCIGLLNSGLGSF